MSSQKPIAILLSLMLIIIVFSCCTFPGNQQKENPPQPTVLRLASDAPTEHMASKLNLDAAKKIKKQTDGRVVIEYYPSGELGSYEKVYEAIMMGNIDIGQISIPDTVDPRFAAAYLPYYATDFEEAKTLYAPDSYMSKLFVDLNEENNVKFLGWLMEGFIGIGTIKTPTDVTIPASIKNLKLRIPEMVTFQYAMQDMGYETATILYRDVAEAMQKQVVDGWIGGTPNMNYAWVGELINKMYINYMYAEVTSYVISEKSLSKLTKEDQEIIAEVFQQESRQSFQVAKAYEQTYKQMLQKDYGVEVIEFSRDEIDENVKYIRNVTWTKLEEVLTPDLMAALRAEVEKLE